MIVTCFIDEEQVVDVIFLDFKPSQYPSGQTVQLWVEQIHAVLADELAESQNPKGCSKWGYICLLGSGVP